MEKLATHVHCWAVMEPKGKVQPFSYTPRQMQPTDVDIQILACGICGSDIHQLDGGWGSKIFPMVPGHEIIGTVVSVGPQVKDIQPGMRVGVGPQCWSCGKCESCKNNEEMMCTKGVGTYNSKHSDGTVTYGGYSTFIRCDARFVIPIPENIPTEAAAPLMCAGITTFAPLSRFGYGPGHHIAVLGIGGLGHMAIKWARALGCQVTAISSNPEKLADAIQLGAHNFLYSKNMTSMKSYNRRFDAILSTVSVPLNWSDYIRLLKPNGRLIFVGLPEEKLVFTPFDFISKQVSVCGSNTGSPEDFKKMFKLASEKNIQSDVQVWPIDNVNEAIQSFRDGKPKYRYVLSMAKL